MDIKQALADFKNHLLTEQAGNPGTVRNYQSYVECLFTTMGLTTVEEITPPLLEEFKKKLGEKGLTKKTINYYLVGIRVFLKFLEKRKVKAMNAYDVEMYKRVGGREIKLLTKEQLKDFLSFQLNDRSDLLAHMLFGTGLRIFELHKLNYEDIRKDNLSITIIGKGDKPRLVYITRPAFNMLEAFCKNYGIKDGPIFKNKDGERLSIRGLQRVIDERREKLLPQGTILSPHVLRHHYATALINQGMPLVHVQKLLGHSSILTTSRYLHVSDKELKDSFSKFSPTINSEA